jgi:hypothetical protein
MFLLLIIPALDLPCPLIALPFRAGIEIIYLFWALALYVFAFDYLCL